VTLTKEKKWLIWRGALFAGLFVFLFLSPWPWDFPTAVERLHLVAPLVWILGWPPITKKRALLCLLGLIPLLLLGIVRLFLWDTPVGSQFKAYPAREIVLVVPWFWSMTVVGGAFGILSLRGLKRLTGGRHRKVVLPLALLAITYLGMGYAVAIGSLLKFKMPLKRDCPFPHEDVTFQASDGKILKGWFVPAKQEKPRGYGICFHCAGGNRCHTGRLAEYLYERGFALLLFDHRGHGESQGHLSTMGPLEIRDVEGALAFLKTKGDVPPGSIFCGGESMGAIMGLIAGGSFPEFGPVWAHASYCDIPSVGGDLLSHFIGPLGKPVSGLACLLAEWITGADYRNDSPIASIVRIAPDPVFLSHGTLDFLIPFAHGERLFEAAGEPKTFFKAEGLIHVKGPFRIDGYEEDVVQFIDEAVAGMPDLSVGQDPPTPAPKPSGCDL